MTSDTRYKCWNQGFTEGSFFTVLPVKHKCSKISRKGVLKISQQREIFGLRVAPYSAAIDDSLFLMQDNARPHRVGFGENMLETKTVRHIE